MERMLTDPESDVLSQYVAAGDRIGYYSALDDWRFSYGKLALGVVSNDDFAGALANGYFMTVSAGEGAAIDGDELATIGLRLMQSDFQERQITGEALTWDHYEGYHQSVREQQRRRPHRGVNSSRSASNVPGAR